MGSFKKIRAAYLTDDPEGSARYMPAVLALAKEHAQPGTVMMFEVRHDDDCPKLSGGSCRCRPIVGMTKTPAPKASN